MDISVENKMLQVESLSHVPFNDLLSLYRQGYRLAGYNSDIVKLGLDVGLDILNVKGNNIRSLATCPSSVQTGATLTLSASASSGTAPYTYHWTVTKPDGSIDSSLANQATNQYVAGLDGNYTVSVYVTDSCAQGAKTSPTDSCVITASTVVIPTKYNCVAGACQGPFATGTYNSLAECQVACTGGGGATKYSCYQNQCVGPYTVGEFNSLAECQASGCGGGGGGGAGCVNCDLANNYCLAGNCIPKKYALFGGIGLVALLVLTR